VVMELAAPRAGQSIVDLYAGCGLFSGSLGAAVGPQGRVDAVEGDAAGAHDCAENLADLTQVTVHHAPVQQWLQGRTVGQDAVFVMDPPRAGVGLDVVQLVASYAPRAVVYVACDPVALARDAAGFGRLGYRVRSLRCLDLFPMTKHVECVALLERE